MFIIAWLSKLQVLSSRQWGGQSSLGVTGLFWLFFSLLLASLATGLRLLFDLGLGTGHLVALGFSGQVCSSQISKTIKGATPGGRLPAEAAGDGWRGLRGAWGRIAVYVLRKVRLRRRGDSAPWSGSSVIVICGIDLDLVDFFYHLFIGWRELSGNQVIGSPRACSRRGGKSQSWRWSSWKPRGRPQWLCCHDGDLWTPPVPMKFTLNTGPRSSSAGHCAVH